MSLHTVTITGADDAVNPRDLFALSRAFPFVEWAVLRSTERRGTNRYPSDVWLHALATAAFRTSGDARFAAHLCGDLCNEVMAGDPRAIQDYYGLFRRYQLNGWSRFKLSGLRVAKLHPELEFIAQATSIEAFEGTMSFVKRFGLTNVKPLFDPSGGRGLPIDLDHLPPTYAYSTGYAGGITPDNVRNVVQHLTGYGLQFWIDMESKVRTNDKLDLDKVHRVLEACAPFVEAKNQ